MLFLEALQAMKDGKQVIRAAWASDFGYLTLLPGAPYIWRVNIMGDKVNAGGYPFIVEDYDADDWKLWEAKKVEENSAEPVLDAA